MVSVAVVSLVRRGLGRRQVDTNMADRVRERPLHGGRKIVGGRGGDRAADEHAAGNDDRSEAPSKKCRPLSLGLLRCPHDRDDRSNGLSLTQIGRADDRRLAELTEHCCYRCPRRRRRVAGGTTQNAFD